MHHEPRRGEPSSTTPTRGRRRRGIEGRSIPTQPSRSVPSPPLPPPLSIPRRPTPIPHRQRTKVCQQMFESTTNQPALRAYGGHSERRRASREARRRAHAPGFRLFNNRRNLRGRRWCVDGLRITPTETRPSSPSVTFPPFPVDSGRRLGDNTRPPAPTPRPALSFFEVGKQFGEAQRSD